jgi:hypothetical protein
MGLDLEVIKPTEWFPLAVGMAGYQRQYLGWQLGKGLLPGLQNLWV